MSKKTYISQCVIIAAGKGTRLCKKGASKPLISLLGVPLIERVIRAVVETDIRKFYVVVGHEGDRVRQFLEKLACRINISITIIKNKDWQQDNGLSVLKTRSHLTTPFLLLMADHLFDTSIVQKLIDSPIGSNDVVLCVDQTIIKNPTIDLDDVTRVITKNDRIQKIGKKLMDYNGFDTGIFLCTPMIFDALSQSSKSNNTTLSSAIQILAKQGYAKAFFIKNKFWIDVDDPNAFKRAEKLLLKQLRDKPNDGPVSRFLNRPLSTRLSKLLLKTPVTPNQISVTTFFLAVIASGLFITGQYMWLIVGGLIAQFASILDGCDGEIARLKFLKSSYGGWLDAVLDRYADAMLLFGLTWYAILNGHSQYIFIIGFFAVIGSFMLSYTADKYDRLMKQRIHHRYRFRMGRDIRVFLILLGTLSNQVVLLLAIIAVIMNFETCRRIIVCKNEG